MSRKGALVARYTASEVVRAGDMVVHDDAHKRSNHVRRATAALGEPIGVAMNSANVGKEVDVKLADIVDIKIEHETEPPPAPPAEQSLERIGDSLREIDPVGAAAPAPSIVITNVGEKTLVLEPIDYNPPGIDRAERFRIDRK